MSNDKAEMEVRQNKVDELARRRVASMDVSDIYAMIAEDIDGLDDNTIDDMYDDLEPLDKHEPEGRYADSLEVAPHKALEGERNAFEALSEAVCDHITEVTGYCVQSFSMTIRADYVLDTSE